MWTIGRDQPVIPGVTFIRWASPLLQVRVGSLRSTFVTARDVPLAAGLPYAFTLSLRFPSGAREPYTRLRCLLGGDRPSQTTHQALSPSPSKDTSLWLAKLSTILVNKMSYK